LINSITMLLKEFYEAPPKGWQDVSQDNSAPKWGDARKTKLTLEMISKIREMNDVMAFERSKDLKKVREQYGAGASDAAAPSL
jgi:hypothetical protein